MVIGWTGTALESGGPWPIESYARPQQSPPCVSFGSEWPVPLQVEASMLWKPSAWIHTSTAWTCQHGTQGRHGVSRSMGCRVTGCSLKSGGILKSKTDQSARGSRCLEPRLWLRKSLKGGHHQPAGDALPRCTLCRPTGRRCGVDFFRVVMPSQAMLLPSRAGILVGSVYGDRRCRDGGWVCRDQAAGREDGGHWRGGRRPWRATRVWATILMPVVADAG